MSKIMVQCYSTDETVNQFSIGYIINPSLNCNKVFRLQVEKYLSVSFASRKMETIRDFLYVISLIMIYDNNGGNSKTMYRVLSFVVYSLIDNYFCIDYLSCQSKTLSSISYKPTFEQTSFNILLGIFIPELLLNLVSCHGFMKKPNSTMILNYLSCLINIYLAKGFYIIENGSKQLVKLPNDVKLIINLIDQMGTYFFIAKNKAISSVANTIK